MTEPPQAAALQAAAQAAARLREALQGGYARRPPPRLPREPRAAAPPGVDPHRGASAKGVDDFLCALEARPRRINAYDYDMISSQLMRGDVHVRADDGGFGDILHQVRYMPALTRRVSALPKRDAATPTRITLSTIASLARLFADSFPDVDVRVAGMDPRDGMRVPRERPSGTSSTCRTTVLCASRICTRIPALVWYLPGPIPSAHDWPLLGGARSWQVCASVGHEADLVSASRA